MIPAALSIPLSVPLRPYFPDEINSCSSPSYLNKCPICALVAYLFPTLKLGNLIIATTPSSFPDKFSPKHVDKSTIFKLSLSKLLKSEASYECFINLL